jgi:hypothetical protein
MKARLGEESRDPPKSPRGVTARLRRYAPALRAAGIEVNMKEKDASTRRIARKPAAKCGNRRKRRLSTTSADKPADVTKMHFTKVTSLGSENLNLGEVHAHDLFGHGSPPFTRPRAAPIGPPVDRLLLWRHVAHPAD